MEHAQRLTAELATISPFPRTNAPIFLLLATNSSSVLRNALAVVRLGSSTPMHPVFNLQDQLIVSAGILTAKFAPTVIPDMSGVLLSASLPLDPVALVGQVVQVGQAVLVGLAAQVGPADLAVQVAQVAQVVQVAQVDQQNQPLSAQTTSLSQTYSSNFAKYSSLQQTSAMSVKMATNSTTLTTAQPHDYPHQFL